MLALANDSRNAVTPAREAEVLERLIEEELLVQRGVELGLAETDFAARRALVQSVLRLALAERVRRRAQRRRSCAVSTATMPASSRRTRASPPASCSCAPARANARIDGARAALANGGDAARTRRCRWPSRCRAARWRRRNGRASSARTPPRRRLVSRPGEVTAPIAASGGVLLVRVESFAAAPAPPYEQIAEQVRTEYDRRADDNAARAYIDRLKRAARIERNNVAD